MFMEIPRLIKIRQSFNSEYISDIESEIREQINSTGVSFSPGASVAVAVGSREIANIHRIVKAAIETIKEKGAEPFFKDLRAY